MLLGKAGLVEVVIVKHLYHCIVSSVQDNLDRVESLIKKHEDFEKTLDTQEEKFTLLDQFAKKLLSGGHYDTVAISKRRDAVLAR